MKKLETSSTYTKRHDTSHIIKLGAQYHNILWMLKMSCYFLNHITSSWKRAVHRQELKSSQIAFVAPLHGLSVLLVFLRYLILAAGRNKAQIWIECFVWSNTAIPVQRDTCIADQTISALWAQCPQTWTKIVSLAGQGTNEGQEEGGGKRRMVLKNIVAT